MLNNILFTLLRSIFMKKFFFIALFLVTTIGYAAVTTTGSGDWNTSIWTGLTPGKTVPDSTDDVVIASGHTITIPASYTALCKNLSFGNNAANIKFAASSMLKVYGNSSMGSGNFYNGGSSSAWDYSAKIVFSGSAKQTFTIAQYVQISQPLILVNIEVNKNADTVTIKSTNGGQINLYKSLTVTKGTLLITNNCHIQGLDLQFNVPTNPTINVASGATLSIIGNNSIYGTSTNIKKSIGNVTISGTVTIDSDTNSTGQNFDTLTINNGGTLNIIGNWGNTGKFIFNDITVNSGGTYNLAATTIASSSHGTTPTFANGSRVIYPSGSSTNLPFSATNYGTLRLGISKSLAGCVINDTLSIIDNPTISAAPTYNNIVLEYLGTVQRTTGGELIGNKISKLRINNLGGIILNSDIISTTKPSIDIMTGSALSLNGNRSISGVIGNVNIFGALNLDGITNIQQYDTVRVFGGANLNITGSWNTGKYTFNKIINFGTYNMAATSIAASSTHGANPIFANGSKVIYGLASSSDFPFFVGNYGSLTLGVDKPLTGCTINDTLSIIDNTTITTRPTYGVGAIIQYEGTIQKIPSFELPSSFSKLRISNSGGVRLTTPITLTSLIFNSAINNNHLYLGQNNLFVNTISGANSSHHIVTDSAGYISKWLRGGSLFIFPVSSSSSSYNNLSIFSNDADTDSTMYNIRVSQNIMPKLIDPNDTSSVIDTSFVIKQTWFINNTTPGSNADITFRWSVSDEGTKFIRTKAAVWQNNAATNIWEQKDTIFTLGNGPYNATLANVSIFSPTTNTGGFIIGSRDTLAKTPPLVLPVELTSLKAITGSKQGVQLLWESKVEVNNLGFEIQRSEFGKSEWKKVGYVVSNSTYAYSYTDNVRPGKYQYRLKQVDMNGGFTYSDVVEVTVAMTENDYKLSAYPVPANPKAIIAFAVKTNEMATIKVYDILGKEIATLFNEVAKANTPYYVEFDGNKFSTGTYFYTLQTPTRKEFKKLLLVK